MKYEPATEDLNAVLKLSGTHQDLLIKVFREYKYLPKEEQDPEALELVKSIMRHWGGVL